MGKKPRSQQRKKGGGKLLEEEEEEEDDNHQYYNNNNSRSNSKKNRKHNEDDDDDLDDDDADDEHHQIVGEHQEDNTTTTTNRNNKNNKHTTITNHTTTKKKNNNNKKNHSSVGGGGGDVSLAEDYTISDSITTFSSNWDDDDYGDDPDQYISHGHKMEQHSTNLYNNQMNQYQILQETLFTLEEQYMNEKRSITRERKLRRLFRMITQYGTGTMGQEIIMNHISNIQSVCLYGIRYGDPSEQYAACRVFEATSIVLGCNHHDWYEEMDTPLRQVFVTTSYCTMVRIASLRTLTMSILMNATNDTVLIESLMNLCECAAQNEFRNEYTPISIRATALDCWSVLGTLIDDFHLAGQDEEQIGRGLSILELLHDCLDEAITTSSSTSALLELRAAAGECVCLIHQARLNLGVTNTTIIPKGSSTTTTTNTTTRRYGKGSWDHSPWETIIDEMKEQIELLANESNHYLNRKTKKQQRATFREYLATLMDNEMPTEIISFTSKQKHGNNITLSDWRSIIQLNYIRQCLQSGFQIQLTTNSTIQNILGMDMKSFSEMNHHSSSMSSIEKRLILSKTSETAKLADKKLMKQRDKRENIRNHFLTTDGEDI